MRAQDEMCNGEDRRQREVIDRQTIVGFAVANAMLERCNDPEGRPHAGQLLQRALGRGAERMMGNIDVQMETCE